jgi:hypothetical protein
MATALIPLLNTQVAHAATTPRKSTHTFGLKARTDRIPAGHRVSRLGIAAADVLPASVDLTGKTITPGDQGALGSCVSWSEGYTIAGYYANAQHQSGAPYAPMYLYSQVHVSSSADGGGSSTGSAWNVLASQGIAEQSVYTQGNYNFTTKPTAAEISNAAAHKMNSATYLFSGANQSTNGINALKASLAAGNPVEIGLPIYQAFEYLNNSNSVMTSAMANTSLLGEHAVAAVGYNSTGLVIENSWGTGWGAGGYGTLAWDFVGKYVNEASVNTGFAAVATLPVVVGLSTTSASTAGGGSLTLTGSAFPGVDASAANAVTLVNVADPSVKVNAAVTSRTATTLTVTIPAAPQVSGAAVAGNYRVVVTSSAGSSANNGTADDFTYIAPVGFSVTGPTTIAASTGGTVTLAGSGFGSTAADATAQKLSATVAGKAAVLKWISDSSATVTVPAGVPGQTIPIVLSRSGIQTAPDTTLKYGANIATTTLRADVTGTRTAVVTGRGLAGATAWTLTSPDGTHSTALPVVTDLSTVTAGVLISSDTSAQLKLPTAPASGAGNFKLSFTPNQTTYPGATFLASSGALVAYAAPTVTKVTGSAVSAAGGSVVTLSGTNLSAVDSTTATAVRLVNSANSAVSVNVPASAITATSMTLTIPVAPSLSGSQVIGDYQIVLTTAQGTVTAPSVLTYLTPFSISVAAGTALPGTGGQVLVRGSGFGATAAAFTAQSVTAQLGAKAAVVAWVNDTTVRVTVPVGVPGSSVNLVLSRSKVPSTALSLPYAAAISKASVNTGPRAGGTLVSVTGAGFGGNSVWTVTTPAGAVLSTLTAVTSADALAAATSGVLVSTDGSATVKMPAVSGTGLTAVVIAVSPDQTLYPSAGYAATSKAVYTYSDLG